MTKPVKKRLAEGNSEWDLMALSPAKKSKGKSKSKHKAKAKSSKGSHSQSTPPLSGIGFSPVKVRTTSGRNTSNASSNSKKENTQRRAESKLIHTEDLRLDIPGLVNIAKPRNKHTLNIAAAISDEAANAIEATVTGKDSGSKNIREWAAWNPDDKRLERDMEPMFDDYVKAVARHIQRHLDRLPGDQRESVGLTARLLLPSDNHDFSPDEADTGLRIDGALGIVDVDSDIDNLDIQSFAEIFAVAEFKVCPSLTRDALVQDIDYTRDIFAYQQNRRFAWGLTGCGSEVRVALFLPDFVLVSPVMHLSTPEGRHSFVELLVYWSLCERDQLGYDTSMRYIAESRCWEFDCYDRASQETTHLYSNAVIANASSVLGRHTRCFVAFPTIEMATTVPIDIHSTEAVVIKDAWALSATGDSESDDRNEAKHLEHIRDTFGGKNLKFPYVYSAVCGDVMIHIGERSTVDSSDNILSALTDESRSMCIGQDKTTLPCRIHRRLCQKPVGEPLRSIKSEVELICVLYDAMQCHTALVEDCKLLHRDISTNNILVVRQNGKARGLLIDFDNAVRLDVQKGDSRRVRTGTLPFMSLNNLRGVRHECTALDDWESLLYLVCWLGTFGINSDDRMSEEDSRGFPINSWRYGKSMHEIGRAKGNHMHSADNFSTEILVNFQPEYKFLKGLAVLRW
ncbi:hypothetical protein EC988_000467 [Linderina pennispora]|nr:hypothetical protein EC988_000467 [Linderina pennispora]